MAIEISTWTDLGNIGSGVPASWTMTADYEQTRSLLSTDSDYPTITGFSGIGTRATPFEGSYDGKNYSINALAVADNFDVGLFDVIESATIQNVHLPDVSVLSGGANVGGLAGLVQAGGTGTTITNCHTCCGLVRGLEDVGGLVGDMRDSTTMSDCSSLATVEGTGLASNTNQNAGGLVGIAATGTHTFTNCFAAGNVTTTTSKAGGFIGSCGTAANTYTNCFATGDVSGSSVSGGFCGIMTGTCQRCMATGNVTATGADGQLGVAGGFGGAGAFALIENCFSTGDVTGVERVAGFYGNANGPINFCYTISPVTGTTTVAGFIGNRNGGLLDSCFWDTEATGQNDGVATDDPDPAGIFGKTTDEMKLITTFTDTSGDVGTAWDFVGTPYDDTASNDNWNIVQGVNNGYPFLIGLPAWPLPVSRFGGGGVPLQWSQSFQGWA